MTLVFDRLKRAGLCCHIVRDFQERSALVDVSRKRCGVVRLRPCCFTFVLSKVGTREGLLHGEIQPMG